MEIPFIVDGITSSEVKTINYEHLSTPSSSTTTSTTNPTISVNSFEFSSVFHQIPEYARNLTDITDILPKFCESLNGSSLNEFMSSSTTSSYEYIKEYSVNGYDVGKIIIKVRDIITEEYFSSEETTSIITIPSVISMKYKLYGITKKFVEWLKVPSEKRSKAYASIFS